MNEYHYLDISLLLDPPGACDIEQLYLKKHILESLNSLYGEVGAAIPVDVLKYSNSDNRFILRVPSKYFVKLYSSLSLSGTYNGYDCFYKVHKTTPYLLSLKSDSRTYNF